MDKAGGPPPDLLLPQVIISNWLILVAVFPKQLRVIVKCKCVPLLGKINIKMERWSPLHLPLWGKVYIIKMNCTPQSDLSPQVSIPFVFSQL